MRSRGAAWRGWVRRGRGLNHHAARRGRVCRGAAWRGTTGQGRDFESAFGVAGYGAARWGKPRRGKARRGAAGISKHHKARHGSARLRRAWQCRVRLGKARFL